jgi:hypothetical protein
MQAIGAAGSSAAGRHVAPPAASSGMLLAGGATPATGDLAAAPLAAESIELVAPTFTEAAEARELTAAGSFNVSTRTPTPQQVVESLRQPDDTSLGDRLEARRDDVRSALTAALRTNAPGAAKLLQQLDQLDTIVRLVRKSEERRRLMKELMRKLLMGVLTPTLIRQAKAMGLTSFLKDAIRSMLQSGNISPQQAKAMSTMLAAAGIRMPELDEFLVRHEQGQAGLVDAARSARGLQPNATASSATGSSVVQSHAGLGALQ